MYLIIDNGNSFLKASVYDQLGNEIAFYEIKNDAISLSFFQEIFTPFRNSLKIYALQHEIFEPSPCSNPTGSLT